MISLFGKNVGGLPQAARIYLDHASATPMLPEAISAMMPCLAEDFGNASAIHTEGVLAKQAVTNARSKAARILGVQPESVVFTSGGTESNNLAIIGTVENACNKGVEYSDMELVTTAIEHPATIKTCQALKKRGVKIKYLPVDENGLIVLSSLFEVLSPQTILVSVSYVNSEVGVIQDTGAIARVIEKFYRGQSHSALLHVDAAQAPLWLPCDLPRLGADLMSLDGGKFGGGKGIGLLARRKKIDLKNIAFGGGQEGGLRPGTEPVAQVVAMVEALSIVQSRWSETRDRVSKVRDYFIAKLTETIPDIKINGALGESRVANNVNVSIAEIDSEFAVISLDVAGVACSTKSACSSAGGGESAVVKALYNDAARASSTLRFTLGPNTTESEIDATVSMLRKHVDSLT